MIIFQQFDSADKVEIYKVFDGRTMKSCRKKAKAYADSEMLFEDLNLIFKEVSITENLIYWIFKPKKKV